MGMELKIPENFFVGAAMSGPQTEGAYKTGGRLESIWDTWSDLSISDFYNKVGSYVGNNFYEKYEDDIKLLKSLHMDSFRTSMQWSRLLTKDGKLNQEGAQFYHKVCKCAKENQIELFMNLYHLICRPICLKEADGKAGMWWKLMQPMPEPLFVSLVQRSGTGLLSTNPS